MTTARPQTTPSGAPADSSGELRGLTGLRIVAAAWVVLFHFHFTPLPGVAEVVGVLGPLITSGALGVDLFFVLSGFVIAYTYLDKLGPALRAGATARFMWARASRMWPAYALVFHLFGLWLVARLVLGSDDDIAFQGVQPVVDGSNYAQQLLMVQLWDDPYFDGVSWVGSTWSISAEWLAYMLFPVAALVFFRLRNLPVVVLLAGSVALMAPIAWAYLSTGSPYYPWSWVVRILCGFGAGVLMYLAVRRLRSSGRVRRGASAVAVAVPVAIVAGLVLGELAGAGRGGAVIALFPLFVGALALADRGPAMLLSQPWAVQGGHISYALYLVHIPIFEVYWLALRMFDGIGPGTVLAPVVGVAVLASTVGAATLLFRLVEEPARRRMRRMAPVAEDRGAVADRDGADRDRADRDRADRDGADRDRVDRDGVDRDGVDRDRVDRDGADRDAADAADRDSADRDDRLVAPRLVDTGFVPPESRHAASPTRRSTLAAALVHAQRRRPTHRADVWAHHERTEYVRSAYLHAGS